MGTQRFVIVAALFAGTATLVGCGGATTETGYTPRKLGMSGPEVRALYAPAFSPESQAQDGSKQGPLGHKPGGI